MSNKQYYFIVFFFVLSTLASFYSGFFLKRSVINYSPNSPFSQNQKFKPNLIDELILISKNKPHKILITSATRTSTDNELNNYTIKIFFFDGNKWTNQISEGKSKELEDIPSTVIIPEWNIISESSYVLEQEIDGNAKIDGAEISFQIPVIHNEMSIKSSPRYTKFMSASEGTLTINGIEYDSYALYNRFYSYNPPENLILGQDLTGLETEWLAFWDEDGNFYNIDDTTVNDKIRNDSYKAHSLAIYKDTMERVQKSFNFKVNLDKNKNYKVDIYDGINKEISVKKINSVNKSINQTDMWISGLATGTITEGNKVKNGFGIYQQISQ
ncbi:MAG: hypothetical protein WA152_03315 [Microgenomates group bacterium]